MVFGGVHRSRFQINDSTVWSGVPDGPAAGLAEVIASGVGSERLAEARQAILEEDYRRAEGADDVLRTAADGAGPAAELRLGPAACRHSSLRQATRPL
ncbi:glycoside hydrolase N-terminal domain-containing protein [Streptomyces sp. NPDC059909]|uniref:glycoside hydrolase N-terminal domain-containing protein n=1 Tax=Streptomyces sp. NPDC059909 TaxID=3346998 RepID=UPI003653CE68